MPPPSPLSPSPAPLDVLRKHWGHEAFRPGQAELIEAVLAGHDALGVLPTGGGKSVCYQVPAVVQGRLTLVVSPLVALMEDQVQALKARGIPAAFAHAGLPLRQRDQLWTDAEHGKYRLVYLAPERLKSELLRARAERLPVDLLAVDEAHCISEWGHDFRPAYRDLAGARALWPDVPCLALTGTATPAVRADIVEQLALKDPVQVARGFDRQEIVWAVYRPGDKRRRLLEIVEAVPGSGLVYAGTRAACASWARTLERQGVSAEAYHAGLDPATRSAVQARWLSGATRVVVATSAFGMGIDKPDVRFVVHVALPPTLESYYQEAGRAGRDGQRAWAVLLVGETDHRLPEAFATEGHPEPAQVQAVYDAVLSLAQVPVGDQPETPIGLDVAQVARTAGVTPMAVRAAVDHLAHQGAWQRLPARPDRALVRFRHPAEALRAFAREQSGHGPSGAHVAGFVDALLRVASVEAFSGWQALDLTVLERRAALDRDRVLAGLEFLAQRDWLGVHPPGTSERLVLTAPRSRKAPVGGAALKASRRRAQRHLADVQRYAASVTCRRRALLGYFGEGAPARCGACDVCLGRHRPGAITPADEPLLQGLLHAAVETDQRAGWLRDTLAPRDRDRLVDWLVTEGYLEPLDPFGDRLALTTEGERWVEATARS